MYNYGVSLSNTPPTPFPSGGFYLGKLVFPKDYPFKPPRIMMITPNGRFQTNTRLCLSISDFHPDTWNPAWSVATILTGLLSFMVRWVVLCYTIPQGPDISTAYCLEACFAWGKKFISVLQKRGTEAYIAT